MYTDSKIIGQKHLLNRIESLSLDTFPHSLILIGEKGSGKHLLSSYISKFLNIEYRELDNKINEEDVESILFNPIPTFYLINLDNALPKLQNNLLKVIEEPPKGTYIIGLSTNSNTILSTLLNRCQKWYIEPYTKEDLYTFVTLKNFERRDLICEILRTPGQILEFQDHPIEDIKKLTDDILERIQGASIPNILNISERIAFKNEKDRFNLDLFVKVIENSILHKIREDNDIKWLKMFDVISHLNTKLTFCMSKQRTFDEFLLELKRV